MSVWLLQMHGQRVEQCFSEILSYVKKLHKYFRACLLIKYVWLVYIDDHSQTSFSTTISEKSSTLDTEDPISFQEESEYNQTVANYPPYCAICSLFQPYFKVSFSKKKIAFHVFQISVRF